MHCLAVVLVKPCDDLLSEVDRLFAPYRESWEGEESVGFWDWWRVGGRFDGRVRGQRITDTPGCRCQRTEDGKGILLSGESGNCSYSTVHEQLEQNAIPVSEMSEVLPWTLVTPEGGVSHREVWTGGDWVERDAEHQRWCAEQYVAHKDCIAVGVDYHS